MNHLKMEHDFFNQNSVRLTQENLNKYIVIAESQLKGSFETEMEAYIFGCQNFGIGNFISKHCLLLENQLLQTFNNRIIF